MEHLQAKVESLQALNAYLKEQVDAKEKAVQDMESRVRSQEEHVRQAFAEVDAQNKKLKKREQLISQALKRLEVPFSVMMLIWCRRLIRSKRTRRSGLSMMTASFRLIVVG